MRFETCYKLHINLTLDQNNPAENNKAVAWKHCELHAFVAF